MRAKRALFAAATAAIAVLVMTGCEVSSTIVVEEDGSGSYAMTLLMKDGKDEAGKKLFDAVKAAAAKSEMPLPVERVTRGDMSGAKVAFEFRSLADLEAETKRLAESGAGLGGVEIERGSTGWRFGASTDGGFVRDPSSAQSGAPGGAIDPAQLGELVHLSVVVTLPGAPGSSNATGATNDETTSTFRWALVLGRDASVLDASTTFVGDQASVPLATELTPLRELSSSSDSGDGGADGDAGGGGGSDGSVARYAALGVVGALVIGGGAIAYGRRRVRLTAPASH